MIALFLSQIWCRLVQATLRIRRYKIGPENRPGKFVDSSIICKRMQGEPDRSGRNIALVYLGSTRARFLRCRGHRSFVKTRSVGNDKANSPLFIHGRRILAQFPNSLLQATLLYAGVRLIEERILISV